VDHCALAVFDGHGEMGAEVAEACKRTFEAFAQCRRKYEAQPMFVYNARNIEALFARMEKDALAARGKQFGGTTGTAAFIRTDMDRAGQVEHVRVLLANAGDSRGVLFRPDADSGRYIALLTTRSHDVSQFDESTRVLQAGARIRDGRALVEGDGLAVNTAMTRALGYGGIGGILAVPDVYCVDAQLNDVIVLGSDGFWERMSRKDAADVLDAHAQESALSSQIDTGALCAAMMQQLLVQRAATASGRRWDNASVVVARIVKIKSQ
jgi:serine/threonine protein phosphatase PrpC